MKHVGGIMILQSDAKKDGFCKGFQIAIQKTERPTNRNHYGSVAISMQWIVVAISIGGGAAYFHPQSWSLFMLTAFRGHACLIRSMHANGILPLVPLHPNSNCWWKGNQKPLKCRKLPLLPPTSGTKIDKIH